MSAKKEPLKLGIVANSIGVFSEEGKKAAETLLENFIEELKGEGLVSKDSIFYPKRIFHLIDADKVADQFVREKVDVVVFLDSAFPNGNAFLTIANNVYLSRLPLILIAPPEIELSNREWTTNAYCGLIMNNHVARQLDRPVFPLSGWPKDKEFQEIFRRYLAVAHTIRELRRDIVGKFGEAPSGFHSSGGNQLAFAKVFGTRVETLDFSAVLRVYQTGKASGHLGEVTFSDSDVDAVYQKMVNGRQVDIKDEKVRNAARMYLSFKSLIEANGFTSASFRCWPEIMQSDVNIAACLCIGWLLSEGVLRSASCEGDWPTAVAQSICALLTDKPGACLDFINYVGGKPVVQLAHCGVGIPSMMQHHSIGTISPDRQGAHTIGPTCIGQFVYGPKTGVSLIQDRFGKFKMLVFTGESRADTDQKLLCCAADVEVKNAKKLDRLILEHGFTHHLAMAFGDISKELKLLCEFYGIEYINPDDE